jgi:molecular chaperone HtpG
LEGVTSFRNYIFDLQKVIKYLSQIAPVNFNPETFSYGNEISDWLSNNLENYGTYNIFLNDIPLYKPYQDLIKTNKKNSDKIIGIEKFAIIIKEQTVAYGWYGIRDELLGGITRGEETSGIRVRVGNILIGDSHLLDGCFREARFNSYVVGEIHVNSPELIPNSRRDDFIDNEFKTLFYNEIEKIVGLPLSKEIRRKSRIQPQKNEILQESPSLKETANKEINKQILTHANVDKLLDDILSVFGSTKEFNQILLKYDILLNHESESPD